MDQHLSPPPPPRPSSMKRSLVALLLSLLSFLLVFLVVVLALPPLVARWRAIESKADADAYYEKRRAELRAEADAAKEMLDYLDKRIEAVSLGFREVVRRVSPAVVNITSFARERDPDVRDSKDWPEVADPETGERCLLSGSGSGVIVKPGWVLTNHHVIASAYRVRVTFASGQAVQVERKSVKSDVLTDLAAIQLPPAPPGSEREDTTVKIEFGNSDELERGDLVLAIGSPLGLKHTVTHGIISAKGRLVDLYDVCEVLQTDAPMNKGNSGGPLFNHRGKLIGINFAIALDKDKQTVGIGFAIPSNTVSDVFAKLERYGEVARGDLGMDTEELTPKQVEALAAGLEKRGALRVSYVSRGLAASLAGLREGDIVVAYNDKPLSPVHAKRDLMLLVMESKVGGEARLEILRDGQKQTLTATVGKRPPDKRKKV
jgi:S1-C subfamily serine protease